MENGPRLAGQVNAGLIKVTEGFKIGIELLTADPRRDGHQDRVAGLLQAARKGHGAVPRALVAVDLEPADLQHAGTGEGLGRTDDLFLQRHRRSDDFECRSGLIQLGDCLVAPHHLPQLGKEFVVFFAILLHAAVVQCHLRQLVEHIRCIQIKIRLDRNG